MSLTPPGLARRVRRHTGGSLSSAMLWLPAAETVNRAARFLLVALMARELAPHAYSAWVVAAALGTILAAGSDVGLSTVITARVAANREATRAYIANALGLVPLLMLLTGAAIFVAAATAARDHALLLILLGSAAMLDSIASLLFAPLRAWGAMRVEGAVRALQGATLLVIGVPLLLVSHASVMAVAALFSLVGLMSACVATVALLLRFGPTRPQLDRQIARGLLRDGLQIFGSVIVTLIYFRADSLLIAWLRGSYETGLYGAAYTLTFGAAFIPLMFQRVLLPRLAACGTAEELRDMFMRSVRNVAAVAICVALCLMVALPLLPTIYGPEYEAARPPFLVLIFALVIYFITYVNYTLLLARSRNGTALLLTAIALAINVSANLALIPLLGATGAALAALFSECGLLAAQGIIIRGMFREDVRIARFAARQEALAA
jgi:O-antigen/teichoic acid export membrane protein